MNRKWLALLPFLAIGLSACGKANPTVSGVLMEECGPHGCSPSQVPVAGQIRVSGPAGTYSAPAGHDGSFSIQAPAGTYDIMGRPWNWTTADYPCGGGEHVTLENGRTTKTTVLCSFP